MLMKIENSGMVGIYGILNGRGVLFWGCCIRSMMKVIKRIFNKYVMKMVYVCLFKIVWFF